MSEASGPATLCERMATNGLGLVEHVVGQIREEIANGAIYDAFEPHALITPAARGDLAAQRHLARWGALLVYDSVKAETGGDQTQTLAESIMVARFAAAHGDRTDSFHLVTLLAMGAMLSWDDLARNEWASECVARLELLAEDGDERCADLLASFAGTESPEVLEEARAVRARLLAVKEAD